MQRSTTVNRPVHTTRRIAVLTIALLVGILLFAIRPTQAAQALTGNSPNVVIAGTANTVESGQARINGSDCDLADAITAANTDSATGDCNAGSGDDTITLLTDITLSAALPDITTNITIEGGGHFIDGNASVRVMKVSSATGDLTLNETTLQNGKTTADDDHGAGLHIGQDSSTTLTNSTVSGNSTAGRSAHGSGIYAANGSVTLTNSTVSGNFTTGLSAYGGGIYAANGSLMLTNSTISDNSARYFGRGNGIYASGGSVTLTNNIIVGNSGSSSARELYFTDSPTLTNNGGNVLGSSAGGRSSNFREFTPSTDDFDASSDQQNKAAAVIINPTLADNGGPTLTHALVSGSPAIDMVATGEATDQRGVARPQGARFDAGAVESRSAYINGGDCKLADAITAANSDSPAGDCNAGSGDDTITLLTNITLNAALPDITTNITIEGDGHFIDGNASVRVMKVSSATGDLTLNETTLQNGKTTADDDHGAGLHIGQDSSVTLTNSTVSGNSTAGNDAHGGGIYAANGSVTLTNSTVSGNSTAGAGAFGGGMYASGGSVTLTNSTISGNSTVGSGAEGGGIYAIGGSVTLINSTVSSNSTAGADAEGGGIYASGGSVTLTNNIVVGNSADNAAGNELYFTSSPVLTNNGGNVLGSSVGSRADNFTNFTLSINDFDASSDQQNKTVAEIINPTLADNGGSTLTHALVSGSPAIDAGGATCSVATDQRGIPRPFDTACDSGAVELTLRVVTTIADVENGDYSRDDISLREALATAINGDIITFDAALSGQQITLAGSQLIINKSVTISASVPISVSANNQSRVFFITNSASVTMDGLTIQDGQLGGSNEGGGFYLTIGTSLTLMNSAVINHSADGTFGGGAGIYSNGGTINVSHSTFAGNSVGYLGGAISTNRALTVSHSTFSNNYANSGGGAISISSGGTLTVINSTLSDNEARSNGGSILILEASGTIIDSTISGSSGGFNGGGIYLRGGPLTVENSTFSDNFANNAGGGIQNLAGTLTVTNSTFSGNATNGAASAIVNYAGTVTLRQSTIVSNTNQADEPGTISTDNDLFTVEQTIIAHNINGACRGSIQSNGYNLDGDGTCLNDSTDLSLIDPLIGPLADNGGNTQTHALLPGSPALDAAGACGSEVDQRGQLRDDLGCDIGAFEVKFADSDTIIEDALDDGKTATFGPTRVRIARSGGAAPGTITVTKVLTETEDDQAFDVIWKVRADTPTGLNLTLTLCYQESEIPAAITAQEANFLIYRQPDSGGAFTALSTTVDAENNCVSAPVEGFSNFGIGLAAPTAVVLDHFAATSNSDGTVTINWETVSEVNHAGFNLYRRSVNGRDDWTAINSQLIASRGSQAQGATYQFVEQNASAGTWEYLLEDVENDGETYRHLDATATVVLETPTAVTLTTHNAVTSSLFVPFMQFVGLLFITLGAVVCRGHDKPAYTPPTVTSYTVAALQEQLGPARAFSDERRSLDEELLFGEESR